MAEPFVLSFSDEKTLGIVETVAASGMLFTSIILGIKGIKKNYADKLTLGLVISGFGMAGFALINNIFVIGAFGFLFFAALPIANNSLDYLARTNIPDELQGRAWGFIGFISQSGYILAYALSGVIADGIGNETGGGVGKGASVTIIISGILLAVIALAMGSVRSIRELENTPTETKNKEAAVRV